MSNCNCKLCDNLVISQQLTFTGGNLVINIPAGFYRVGKQYCIVIAQNIPDTVTRDAPVVITIGDGTEIYPLTYCNGSQVLEQAICTRHKYPVCVFTNEASGGFRLLRRNSCCNNNRLDGLDGTAPTTPTIT